LGSNSFVIRDERLCTSRKKWKSGGLSHGQQTTLLPPFFVIPADVLIQGVTVAPWPPHKELRRRVGSINFLAAIIKLPPARCPIFPVLHRRNLKCITFASTLRSTPRTSVMIAATQPGQPLPSRCWACSPARLSPPVTRSGCLEDERLGLRSRCPHNRGGSGAHHRVNRRLVRQKTAIRLAGAGQRPLA